MLEPAHILRNRTLHDSREIRLRGLQRRSQPVKKPALVILAPAEMVGMRTARRGSPNAAKEGVQAATPAPRREIAGMTSRSGSTFTALTLWREVPESRRSGSRSCETNPRGLEWLQADFILHPMQRRNVALT